MEKAFHARCVREKEGFKTLCRKGFGVGDQPWESCDCEYRHSKTEGAGVGRAGRRIFNVYALDFAAL